MSEFAQELKAARAGLGHKTARSFFDWLKAKGVSFNYSYYMRLEQGALPSEKVTRELAAVLKGEWPDRLVLAHCRALFPKNTHLFSPPAGSEASASPAKKAPGGSQGQKELSLKQVALLASSELNYHLFLLSTLARKPISEKELMQWFPAKALSVALKELGDAGLVQKVGGGFEAVSVESRFPEAYNKELKEAYAKFDLWDEAFGGRFGLDFLMNKMLIRRVSGRYLVIIRKQLDLLFELVKGSDELETRFNENVLQLRVVLRQGKLPG
jgi:hypothetical protein